MPADNSSCLAPFLSNAENGRHRASGDRGTAPEVPQFPRLRALPDLPIFDVYLYNYGTHSAATSKTPTPQVSSRKLTRCYCPNGTIGIFSPDTVAFASTMTETPRPSLAAMNSEFI
jgi:hypothetical protein